MVAKHVPWEYEDLMVNLIKSDLIHSRLLHGLRQMSLEPDDYFLNLDNVILWLFGIREPKLIEDHKDLYHKLAEKASKFDPTYKDPDFEILAREIFEELKLRKVVFKGNHSG